MHRKQSRRLEFARRLTVYLLMGISVVVLLIVLTLTVIGYRFNFSTNTVEQTGLVQYDSTPRGALVKVDGNNYESTPTKGMVLPGQHQFSMSLKGYENWQKTLDIQSGAVTWLSYVRMVPIEKKVEKIDTIPAIDASLTSPDKKFLIGIRTAADGVPETTLVDLRDSRQPKVTTSNFDTVDLSGYGEEKAASHKFNIVNWSRNNRYVILKHDFIMSDQPATEWLWWDRETPEKVVNVTKLLNLPIRSLEFGEGREIYLLQDNGDLRRATTNDGTITRPLVSNVTSFDVYDKTISYIARQDENTVAGIWRSGWEKPVVLASVPQVSQTKLHIGVSNYFNQDTAVISDGSAIKIYRGALPSSKEAKELFLQSPEKFTLNRPVQSISFNDSGRFVVAEDETGLVSYDLERSTVSQEIKKNNPSPIKWLDSFYIWQTGASSKLTIQEFDGMNLHELNEVASGHDIVLTQDSRFIYSLALNENKTYDLERLAMTVSNR